MSRPAPGFPIDALAEYGIRHIDMPATPARVWARSAPRTPHSLTPAAARTSRSARRGSGRRWPRSIRARSGRAQRLAFLRPIGEIAAPIIPRPQPPLVQARDDLKAQLARFFGGFGSSRSRSCRRIEEIGQAQVQGGNLCQAQIPLAERDGDIAEPRHQPFGDDDFGRTVGPPEEPLDVSLRAHQ